MNAIDEPQKAYAVDSDATKAHSHEDDDKEHEHDLEGGATSNSVAAPQLAEERYSMWSYHEKLLIITLTGSASMLSYVF